MQDTRRNHRRAFPIDGRVGYTGGVAVDDKWLGRARTPDEWHDLCSALAVPLRPDYRAVFPRFGWLRPGKCSCPLSKQAAKAVRVVHMSRYLPLRLPTYSKG